MIRRFNWLLLLPLLGAMPACQAAPTLVPSSGATLVVAPQLLRHVLAGAPFAQSDIVHVMITLSSVMSGVESIPLAGVDVPAANFIFGQATFDHLHPNTTYRVRAIAYTSTDTSAVASDPAGSSVDVTVANDDHPAFSSVPVKLLDLNIQAYNGTADSVAISAGGLTQRGAVDTLAGTGVLGLVEDPTGTSATTKAQFKTPKGLAVDLAGNVYVADTLNNLIRKITPAGAVTAFAGTGTEGFLDDPTGTTATTKAKFNNPSALVVDAQGNVYVADTLNCRIRKITPTGAVTTLAGTGVAGFADDASGTSATTQAKFELPQGITVDAQGNVYVADTGNNRIRKITPAGAVTSMAGSNPGSFADDPAGTSATTQAKFASPTGLAVDALGNVYVADTSNHRIRKITPLGAVTTLAGKGHVGGLVFADDPAGTSATTQALFNNPSGLAIDAAGNLYVADTSNNRVRKVTAEGAVTTLAGQATFGFVDDPTGSPGGSHASFKEPLGIAVNANGVLYVADTYNFAIREVY